MVARENFGDPLRFLIIKMSRSVTDTNCGNGSTKVVTVESTSAPTYTLQLRPRATVSWEGDVVDNEGAGRRSSKKC